MRILAAWKTSLTGIWCAAGPWVPNSDCLAMISAEILAWTVILYPVNLGGGGVINPYQGLQAAGYQNIEFQFSICLLFLQTNIMLIFSPLSNNAAKYRFGA